jgi:hypothetical protein
MNERIALLALRASDSETGWLDRQKFAEMIVRECIQAIQNESMNSDDDWERGLRIAECAIQNHFGVEE